MALYHIRAEKLKPQILKANFTPEQLTIVLKMMRGCTQLRQGKVITSFLECMLPDEMEIKAGKPKQTLSGRTYTPLFVVKKGDPIPETKPVESVGKCEAKIDGVQCGKPSSYINEEGLEVCTEHNEGDDDE